MAVTIKQIAEHLKVSPITVSKGLNNTGRLSNATRQRVQRAASKLGYRPNAAARAMVSGRFNQVGLLLGIDGLRSHLPGDLLYGVHDALAERGIHLTITRLPDAKLTSDDFVPIILKETAADGLLVNYRTGLPAPLVTQIRRHSIPSIWIESAQPSDGIDIDHRDGAEQLTRYLIELGHRHIAFADHYVDHRGEVGEQARRLHPSLIERREGYEAVMRAAGLPTRFIHRPQATPVPDRIDIAREWLSQADRPTAIVAYVQATAWPIIMAAQSIGLRVPQDLSVVTFSDSPALGFKMTEMRLPESELGKQAVQMLLAKIENPRRALPSVRLKSTLSAGATSAAPKLD